MTPRWLARLFADVHDVGVQPHGHCPACPTYDDLTASCEELMKALGRAHQENRGLRDQLAQARRGPLDDTAPMPRASERRLSEYKARWDAAQVSKGACDG